MQRVLDTVFSHIPHLESNILKEKTGETCRVREHKMDLPNSVRSSSRRSPPKDQNDIWGDIFMWGEGIGGTLGGGLDRIGSHGVQTDVLLPRLLESTDMLDIQKISCGGKHAALITRQGKVFCWGEENGGRLGHKINIDVPCPKVIESLVDVHIESISCGEYQTCALTSSGELYAWGDTSHGVDPTRSQWLPHKVSSLLDGIFITRVACGEWHTAILSSSGQLFTYGDGTFGVLGHGDLQSVSQPKEVESLKGLRVKSVACGSWHTAAIVEIIIDRFKYNCSGGKLFTWGDNDSGRLGHRDRERKLLPTCVASLVDHDMIQVSCGRLSTIALTVTGIVCTMGNLVSAQLRNPQANDRSVAIVGGALKDEFVKEVSSGSFHVAVLTTKGEIYTWGKGANGRLGLGDMEDRKFPVLVEALKDRKVQRIACGSSFTAAICLHETVLNCDQSICSGCRMVFGFTRKKHHCYNCGLVFCHSCSTNKAVNASFAPSRSKPCRVCDSCYAQLRKSVECRPQMEAPSPRRPFVTWKSSSNVKTDKGGTPFSWSQVFSPKLPTQEQIKFIEGRFKQGRNQRCPLSDHQRWGQVPCPIVFDTKDGEKSMSVVSPLEEPSHNSLVSANLMSPIPRSTVPNTHNSERGLKKSEKILTEEVLRLRIKAQNLSKQCQIKSEKIQNYKQRIDETWSLARDEAAKCKAAKDVIKVLTNQMNAMSGRILSGRQKSSISSVLNEKLSMRLQQINPIQTELPEFENTKSLFEELMPSVDNPTENKCERNNSIMSSNPRRITSRASKDEWVEQDYPGVYITLTTLSNDQRGLKRVRFSRKRFSEKEAELWWVENQERVYLKYRIENVTSQTSVSMKS
ncbi:Ultraviolet-B receptor UVR8 [Acorus calamus]|uniref:Ultraviolet-B receptor UVR8 n=1 Tax=Acorus calamus TaxID=4465 RepID=A0AAV9FIU2_ACOCL|nr:Ultraviolet-B receptor UVR8 [Acorus calamus]